MAKYLLYIPTGTMAVFHTFDKCTSDLDEILQFYKDNPIIGVFSIPHFINRILSRKLNNAFYERLGILHSDTLYENEFEVIEHD